MSSVKSAPDFDLVFPGFAYRDATATTPVFRVPLPIPFPSPNFLRCRQGVGELFCFLNSPKSSPIAIDLHVSKTRRCPDLKQAGPFAYTCANSISCGRECLNELPNSDFIFLKEILPPATDHHPR